jgi:hypothetical protein
MASYQQIQSPFFGLLPAELRINIYEHLLADCKGDKSTIKNEVLVCSRFKDEIEPLIARIGLQNLNVAIAEVKQRWAQLHPDKAPLAINIEVKGAKVSETQVSITLPKSEFNLASSDANYDVRTLLGPFFEYLLGPLLEFRLHQLAIVLSEDEVSTSARPHATQRMVVEAIREMRSLLKNSSQRIHPRRVTFESELDKLDALDTYEELVKALDKQPWLWKAQIYKLSGVPFSHKRALWIFLQNREYFPGDRPFAVSWTRK